MRQPTDFLRGMLLPLLLLVFPLAIIFVDPVDEASQATEDARRELWQESAQHVENLRRESAISHWAERALQQVTARLQPTTAPAAIEQAAQAGIRHVQQVWKTPCQLWVTGNDGKGEQRLYFSNSENRALGRALRRLATILVRPGSGGDKETQLKTLSKFLKTSFGPAFDVRALQDASRGKPWGIVHQGKPWMFVWNTYHHSGHGGHSEHGGHSDHSSHSEHGGHSGHGEHGGHSGHSGHSGHGGHSDHSSHSDATSQFGAAFLLFPLAPDPGRQALRLCLEVGNAHTLRSPTVAFLRLTGPPQNPVLFLAPPTFRHAVPKQARAMLAARFRFVEGNLLLGWTLAIKSFLQGLVLWPFELITAAIREQSLDLTQFFPTFLDSRYVFAENLCGRIVAPWQEFADIVEIDQIGSLRWFSLPPETKAVGVLLWPARKATKAWTTARTLVPVGLVIILIFGLTIRSFGVFPGKILGIFPRKMPEMTVRTALTGWFLLLLLAPLILVWSANQTFRRNLRMGLMRNLEERLAGALRPLEMSVKEEMQRRTQLVREQLGDGKHLAGYARSTNAKLSAWLASCEEFMQNLHMASPNMLLYGLANSANFKTPDVIQLAAKFPKENAHAFNEELNLLLGQVACESLLGSRSKKWESDGSGAGTFVIIASDIRRALMREGEAKYMRLGSKTFQGMGFPLRDVNGTVMIILWDGSLFAEKLLLECLPDVSQRLGMELAAFHRNDYQRRLIVSTATDFTDDMLRLAQHVRDESVQHESRGSLVWAAPFGQYSDFVIASRLPLDQIETTLRNENLVTALLFVGVLAFAAGAAQLLGTCLAQPIQSMTTSLAAIAEGDLAQDPSSLRNDELGSAGQQLRTMVHSLRERRQICTFLSNHVVSMVAGGSIEQAMAPTRRPAAVLVSDIRNFTSISETSGSEAVFSALDQYLKLTTPAIQAHEGWIDRFVGDAIQAVFYDDNRENAASRAVAAACEMMNAHADVNRQRAGQGLFTYRIGIGIAYGEVLTGVLGDAAVRLDLQILGDALEEAEALEAASKFAVHSRIVIADSVRQRMTEPPAVVRLPPAAGIPGWEVIL